MLVFACAGMDRACKALVEDGFPELAKMDDSVEEYLAGFAKRMISSAESVNATVVARLLLDPYSPREAVLRALVADLTGDSLQSVQQLFRLCTALRVPDQYVKDHKVALAQAFRARNAIVHEMDIVPGSLDTEKGEVQRAQRPHREYVEFANATVGVAVHLISGLSTVIEIRLRSHPFQRVIDGGSP
ncbi:MAG TPA: hypothetical protein VM347_26535 [Nonomuraea sp.]|nr:hypothetical protein [Nonomuraea sp.]